MNVSLVTDDASGGDAEGDTISGFENVEGSAHGDTLSGDGSANRLFGLGGADRLIGGGGDDVLEGGAGADVLSGSPGTDTVSYAGSAAAVMVNLATGTGLGGDAQGDTISEVEHVEGSAHGDVLTGDNRANRLFGAGGDDTLEGGAGADVLDGGADADTASYAGSAAAVRVNLLTDTVSGGDAQGDMLVEIENLEGSAHGDVLTGDHRVNRLSGLGG